MNKNFLQESQSSVSHPSARENFETKYSEIIKDKLSLLPTFNAHPGERNQILAKCKQFLKLMIEINTCDYPDHIIGDISDRNQFLEEFLEPTVVNILDCQHNINDEFLYTLDSCIQQTIFFTLKLLDENHLAAFRILKRILDPSKKYYRLNRTRDVFEFTPEITPEHQSWLEDLKEGDQVDCVRKIDEISKMVWTHAIVTNNLNTDFVEILFMDDLDGFPMRIDKRTNAHGIVPSLTKCENFEWRENLKTGDEINIFIPGDGWLISRITDSRMISTVLRGFLREINVQIFYKVNKNSKVSNIFGFRKERQRKKWYSIYDPLISQKIFDLETIDDTFDKVYDTSAREIYGVQRTGDSYTPVFIQLLNYFGEQGGFDIMYKKIMQSAYHDNMILILRFIYSTLAKVSLSLHKDFALEYIPKFKEAAWGSLLKQVKLSDKPLYHNKICQISQNFKEILQRIYSAEKIQNFMCELHLNFCETYFESKSANINLQGLYIISQLIRNIQNRTTVENSIVSDLKSFLKKNQIFSKIFGPEADLRLLEQAGTVVRFMFKSDLIESQDFYALWESTNRDSKTKLAILEILSFSSIHLKSSHSDYLLSKISQKPPQHLIKEDLKLIYKLCKCSQKSDNFIKESRDFFWRVILCNTKVYSKEIVSFATQHFSAIMKDSAYKAHRMKVLFDCIANLEQDVAVLDSLTIIRKTVEHYPMIQYFEAYKQASCVDYLCQEKDLFRLVLQKLRCFKEKYRANVQKESLTTEESFDNIIDDEVSYKECIISRIAFLSFLVSKCSSDKKIFGYELFVDSWSLLVENGSFLWERQAALNFIRKVVEKGHVNQMNIDDLLKFFREEMNGKKLKEYKSLTPEGYECFLSLFLLINKMLQNITENNKNNLYNLRLARDFLRRIVNILPKNLEGIDSIWDFILYANEKGLVQNAQDFLQELYFDVKEELKPHLTSIRQDFLTTAYIRLEEILKSRKETSEPTFHEQCKRWFVFVDLVMDESEQEGIGRLKPLCGITKGELVNLEIKNGFQYGERIKNATFKCYENTTMFELLVKIAQVFKVKWDEIRLIKQFIEIDARKNGKTLGELNLKNFKNLSAKEKITNSLNQEDLIDKNGTLNPKLKQILLEWFREFADHDKIGPERLAALITSVTDNPCNPVTDIRVIDSYERYDDDKDGFITPENFMELFLSSCKNKPSVVWSNLYALGYRNDLRHVKEAEIKEVLSTSLTRYMFVMNDKYFELVYSMLDLEDEIASNALEFLKRLPTNPKVFSDIIRLKGVREMTCSEDRNWNIVLDSKSKYRMCYCLYVVDYFMEKACTKEDMTGLICTDSKNLYELEHTWKDDFISLGGLSHISKIFETSKTNFTSKPTRIDMDILYLILKILKNSLLNTFTDQEKTLLFKANIIELIDLLLSFTQNFSIENYISAFSEKPEEKDKKSELKKRKNQESAYTTENLKKKFGRNVERLLEFGCQMEKLTSVVNNNLLNKKHL